VEVDSVASAEEGSAPTADGAVSWVAWPSVPPDRTAVTKWDEPDRTFGCRKSTEANRGCNYQHRTQRPSSLHSLRI